MIMMSLFNKQKEKLLYLMTFLSLKPMGWSGYKSSNIRKMKHKLLQRNVFHSEKS